MDMSQRCWAWRARSRLISFCPMGRNVNATSALALIVERLIDLAAKLATARALDENTAINSLGVTLGLGSRVEM
jgi:hypothetical protein